jgi:hypothetical protein
VIGAFDVKVSKANAFLDELSTVAVFRMQPIVRPAKHS